MNAIRVELLELDLWTKFNYVTNEMIVTKSGRRMFPVVKIRITGLEARSFYEITLEFVQVGTGRWKYLNGAWVNGGKAEAAPTENKYMHPDSPNFGDFWMNSEGVSFNKVKLTNKPNPQAGQVSSLSVCD
jgi:brachyury protein